MHTWHSHYGPYFRLTSCSNIMTEVLTSLHLALSAHPLTIPLLHNENDASLVGAVRTKQGNVHGNILELLSAIQMLQRRE